MCIKGRLTKMKCCEKCGQELDANTGLCPKCDKKKTSINPKKFKKRYIIIPVAFLLICTIVLLCFSTCNKISVPFVSNGFEEGKIEVKHCTYNDVSYKNNELFVKSQLLITPTSDYSYNDIESAVSGYNGKIVGYIEFTNDYQVEFSEMDYDSLNSTMESLEKELNNTDIMLNRVVYQDEETDKTTIKEFEEKDKNGNWWRDAIRLTELESESNNYQEVKVGIYDTLFDTDNEDLKYAINKTDIWYNNEKEIEVSNGGMHGTNVTGFLAAKKSNDYGIDGVANNVKVFGYAYRGNTPNYHPVSIMDLKYWNAKMLAKGVKVINISAGNGELLVAAQNGSLRADYALRQVSESLGKFYRKYIDAGYEFVVVKSSGNENGYQWIHCTESKDNPYGVKIYDADSDGDIGHYTEIKDVIFEAKYDIWGAITDSKVKNRIIVVGSSSEENTRAYHSVSGERVDLYAPGERLRELTSDKPGYGTSYAAPMVSGTVALMWGVNPNIEADKIKYLLVSSATQLIEDENYQIQPDSDNVVKMYKCLLDVKGAVDRAKTYDKITPQSTENTNVSYLLGIVRIYEDGKIQYNKEDCKVSIYKNNSEETLYKELSTDEYGEFETDIESGTYIIKAETKDGTYVSDRYIIKIEANDAKYINDIYMYPNKNAQISNTSFTCDKYLVEYDNVVYYVDRDGLWRNTGKEEGELLYDCEATNIATNGEVIYYSVYHKDVTAFCKEYNQDMTWHQYDLYSYDLRTSLNSKVTSFNECGKPICYYNGKIYYTDYNDDFNGFVTGLAQSLYSYDLSTGEKEYISDKAGIVIPHGSSIYFRDMLASMDLSSAKIQCLDLTNGKVKQITSDGVSEMVLSEDNLFYTIYTYKTITGSDNHSYTKENCKVHKYNTLDGTDELIFNEESDSIRIQYVDDEYIYYSSDEPYYNYRLNLTTHEKTYVNSQKWSRNYTFGVYKLNDSALYYHRTYFYLYELKDDEKEPKALDDGYRNGAELLTINNNRIYFVYDDSDRDYFFYRIAGFDFSTQYSSE